MIGYNDAFKSPIKNIAEIICIFQISTTEESFSLYENVKEQLPAMIKNHNELAAIFKCISTNQCQSLSEALKEKLPHLIPTIDEFVEVIRPQSLQKRAIFFECLKSKLPEMIIQTEDYTYLSGFLPEHQRTVLMEVFKDKWVSIIKNPIDYVMMFPYVTIEQRAQIYDSIKSSFPSKIKSVDDFIIMIRNVSDCQRAEVFNLMKAQLPQMIDDTSHLVSLTLYLSVEQRTTLSKLLRSKMSTLINDHNDITNIIKFIPPAESNAFCKSINAQLQAIIRNPIDFAVIIKNLHPEQSYSFLEATIGILSTIIKNDADFNSINSTCSSLVVSAKARSIIEFAYTLRKIGFEVPIQDEVILLREKYPYFPNTLMRLFSTGFTMVSHPLVYQEILKRFKASCFDPISLVKLLDEFCSYASSHLPNYNEDEIKCLIELHSSKNSDLLEGPIYKQNATKQIEEMLSKIAELDVPDFEAHAESMIYYDGTHYWINLPNDLKHINLSLLLNDANLSHIKLKKKVIEQIGNKLSILAVYPLHVEENPILKMLPPAQRTAISVYISEYYRNINKLFRTEPMDETPDRLLVPSLGKNRLACFLLGCLLNDAAVKSPLILQQMIYRLKLSRLDTPLTDEESSLLENLERMLNITIYDRGEFLTDEIIMGRICNPTRLPALTSISARRDGSHYFQNKNSTRTRLSNNPYIAILRRDWKTFDNEAEAFVPQGEYWLTVSDQEKQLISTFVRSPILQQKPHYHSMMALLHAYRDHLSHEYKETSSAIEINGKTIYRPNHDLSHTYRVMGNIELVVDYFKDHAKDAAFKEFCIFIQDEELEWLRIAAAFSVTGRESEIAAKEDLNRYDSYRAASQSHVAAFISQLPLDDKAKERISHIVRWMGNPQYEKMINDHEDPQECQLRNYYHRILTIAHKLDLPRCYDSESFDESMRSCRELSNDNEEQRNALQAIIRYSIELIKMHGSHLSCDIDLHGKLFSTLRGYQPVFVDASSDINRLESLTRCVAKPRRIIPLGPTVITHSFNKKRELAKREQASGIKKLRSLGTKISGTSSAASSSSSSSSTSVSSSCDSSSYSLVSYETAPIPTFKHSF